jgi:uncharacterized protein YigE (DUF2233 family)
MRNVRSWRAVRLAASLLFAAWAGSAAVRADEPQPCHPLVSDGHAFDVCVADLRLYRLKLYWRDKTGAAYGSLKGLVAALQRDGSPPVFAMNAGMYRPDLSPVGLYVEDGVQLRSANVASGPGNFHMKPNGVFYVHDGKAAIQETAAYLKAHIHPDLATQSGPMLVIGGRLHPRFAADSTSRKIRNGVGIRAGGDVVVFAISEDAVTFSEFALMFRDALACPDALFLDGSISSLYAPPLPELATVLPAGPMVAAFRRQVP